MRTRSPRGYWLIHWATQNDFIITNTHGAFEGEEPEVEEGKESEDKKNEEESWTYINSSVKRQLDYILVDKKLHASLRHASVQDKLDIGSDHRAV